MQATETGGLPSNPQSRAFLVWPLSTCSLPYEYLGLDIPFLGRRFGGVLMASCGVRWCGHVLVLSASFPTYTQPWPKINVSCDNGQPKIQVLALARPRHWHTYPGHHIPEQRLMGPQFFPPPDPCVIACLSLASLGSLRTTITLAFWVLLGIDTSWSSISHRLSLG